MSFLSFFLFLHVLSLLLRCFSVVKDCGNATDPNILRTPSFSLQGHCVGILRNPRCSFDLGKYWQTCSQCFAFWTLVYSFCLGPRVSIFVGWFSTALEAEGRKAKQRLGGQVHVDLFWGEALRPPLNHFGTNQAI